ncbi:MAG: radical SAM family heme chaperone HemW [Thermodesulfobacteriota bacterium]
MRLYVHIPFCRSKCSYCAFFSQKLIPESKEIFFTGLKREIVARGAEAKGALIRSIYFGGGTPSVLPLSDLQAIIELITANFDLDRDIEFSMEGNPESMRDRDYIRGLMHLGINRVSIGLQSLRPEMLEMLGRLHTARQGLDTVLMLQDCGLDNVGVDLIWGLPGQKTAGWMEDLKSVVRYQPRHISCYCLTLEPGTPLARRVGAGQFELPAEEEQARMYIYGAEYLESSGMLQYEVSNFARMGYACSHNQAYWQGEEFVGLGPSSVSTLGGYRRQNPSNIKDYARMPLSLSSDSGQIEFISRGKALREKIMLSLRTARGLCLKEYRELCGRDFCASNQELIEALHKHNLVRIRGGYLRLTKNGMLVSDAIISRIIDSTQPRNQ